MSFKIHFYSTTFSKVICGADAWKFSNVTDELNKVTCAKCKAYLNSKTGPKATIKLKFLRQKK